MTKDMLGITELLDVLNQLGFTFKEENFVSEAKYLTEHPEKRCRVLRAESSSIKHKQCFLYTVGNYSQLDSMRHNKQFLNYVLTQIRNQLENGA